MPDKENFLRDKMINIGKELYALRLVAARAGNLSARLDKDNILITTTGTSLGKLRDSDIVKININSKKDTKNKRLTTEFPLHRLIYKNFPIKTVIHCHPPLVNGYFCVYSNLKVLTFEAKLYLGSVPVIKQETPTITQPELVIEALKTNNLVVIKNHGIVAVAENFMEGLHLVETLEEAVKVVSVARLFNKEILNDLDKALKASLVKEDLTYTMFSKGHIQKIVDLVNQDEFIAKKGQELDLTVKLAIKLEGEDKVYPVPAHRGGVYKFDFQKGKIAKLEFDADAPFVISAPPKVWELIFLGKLDPFVATTQGKMKLKGDLGKLSRWYVPFSRLFELFKQVKIK